MAAVIHSRVRIGIALVAAILVCAALASPVLAAEAGRPLLLLFDTVKGEGTDKELAASTTKALRMYFRETQKVEVAIFDRQSPTVTRAIMEKNLTPDRVADYASQTERLQAARELGFQYAAGAEVSIKTIEVKAKPSGATAASGKNATPAKSKSASGGKSEGDGSESEAKPDTQPPATVTMNVLEVKLWTGKVGGTSKERWEAIGTASAAGAGERDLDNAMQSSSSFAVNDIANRAFADLRRVAEKNAEAGADSTAIVVEAARAGTSLTANDYAAQADASLKGGNIALAIQQYSQAVNADPSSGALRVKLADAYAAKGLYAEAENVLRRAEAAGADKDLIAVARQRMDGVRTGTTSATDSTASVPEQKEERAVPDAAPGKTAVSAAIAKMVEGDKLWGDGKPDDAATAYSEAIKLNPSDWRAYERLAVVDASISLFGESRRALEMLAKVQPQPSDKVASNRYEMLKRSFDQHFLALLKQYETNAADFDKHTITRESYYNTVKGLAVRLESMASFLDALKPPSSKQSAYLRRSVACGLAAQAATSLLDYLESNNEKRKANAAVFVSQAKAEMDAADEVSQESVVAERRPAPQEPPASQEAPADPAEPGGQE